MNRKILVVDDDHMTVNLIQAYLQKDQYQVLTADHGLGAIEVTRQQDPDLIILDLMLPQLDGLDVCRVLRAQSDVPIIMLTAKTTEEDVLTGLELGADDYITKPFSPRELVARVRTVLRRFHIEQQPANEQVRYFGDLVVRPTSYEATINKQPVHLTPREFKLLDALSREPGRVFSRSELLEQTFGFDSNTLERTVDYHIMNLRRKIEQQPQTCTYIETVFGVGYKFTTGPYTE